MSSLRLLLVEDSSEDARLLLRDLRRDASRDFDALMVSDEPAFERALDDSGWDLILSDVRLLDFNAAAALRIINARALDLPVIIHSSMPWDSQLKTELVALGARDFFLKGSADMLMPSIEKQIRELSERRERAERELMLRKSMDSLERQVAEQAIQLRIANKRLVQQMQEREQLHRLIAETAEEERQRLGYEIHDGLCQKLTGVRMLLSALTNKLQTSSHIASLAEEISQYLGSAVEEARNLARGVQPVEPRTDGLMDALSHFAEDLSRNARVSCQFHCPVPLHVENPHMASHLFRIAQEAAHNGIRHGNASRIVIKYRQTSAENVLMIRDNGSGFVPPPPGHTGMGVNIMHYRAAKIGASLEIRKSTRGGTEVACLW